MEQIKFSQNIEQILRIINYNYLEFEHPLFVGGIREVLAYLQMQDRIYEEDKKTFVRKKGDLFEEFKEMNLSTYGVTLFKTAKGSTYIFDIKTGTSLRFQTKEDWNYYLIHEPSLSCGFIGPAGVSKEPGIGFDVYETYGSKKTHAANIIIEVG